MKKVIKRLYQLYKTYDPFELAERKNIIVQFEPLGSILGYYSFHKRVQFIHINEQLEENMQRLVCAHELGHAILHPKVNTSFLKKNTFFSIDKLEMEANLFAVELLMPDEYLYELNNTSITLREAAAMYGVPKEIVHLKNF
ncbi:ImmA/IrrE family metallo-endopeptidase [Heyndrickxia sp. NPDC080065]|uniref:ImmA/IrrE family metallo-endopeptidase n=1 Tax=Heyndrickxia sp. NPDC080065 TaxID=3390568 RepID=UPI003CFE6063